MINVQEQLRLREILREKDRFSVGVELVSTRGSMSQEQTRHTRAFASELTHSPEVDWVSITDNAGGNPQLAPMALGTPILYAGKEVVIHLTCKDLNRHALESQLWMYASQGFHNILAMTGDYPMNGPEGMAKPVFDTDSVGLLHIVGRMNDGLEIRPQRSKPDTRKLEVTHFHPGAVVNPFKQTANALMPQYFKLLRKIRSGARFVIPQIGYDARQSSELLAFLHAHGHGGTPVIGNVYVLNRMVARLFHQQKIPGVRVNQPLLELCERQAASPDRGKAFFLELAAKQAAMFKHLGYRGAYLGGVHRYEDVDRILHTMKSFSEGDAERFVKEFDYSDPADFRLYAADPETGLVPCDSPRLTSKPVRTSRQWTYRMASSFHNLAFRNGKGLAPLGKRICNKGPDGTDSPAWLRWIEKGSKSLLFQCMDCGDCSLSETAFLCPVSQCPKNQRNGPCGGSRGIKCEVVNHDCIWSRAYDRRASASDPSTMLDYTPVFQDQSLRHSSAWANYWHRLDHQGKPTQSQTNPNQEIT